MQRGVEFRLAGDICGLIRCINSEQRPQRNALRVERGIGRVVAGERYLCVGLDGRVDCGGRELSRCLVIGEVGLQADVGDGLLLDNKAGNLDSRIELRIVESALALGADTDYACWIHVAGLKTL